MEIIVDAFLDALIDGVKMLPFLYLAYLLIEWLERHHGENIESALAGGRDHIAANRADVKPGFQHITGAVLVHDLCPGKQLRHGDVQRLCQRLQQHNIRQPFSRLPLGNGLVADIQQIRQLFLRHAAFFPEHLDGLSGHIGIHKRFLLWFVMRRSTVSSITEFSPFGNLRCVEWQKSALQTQNAF